MLVQERKILPLPIILRRDLPGHGKSIHSTQYTLRIAKGCRILCGAPSLSHPVQVLLYICYSKQALVMVRGYRQTPAVCRRQSCGWQMTRSCVCWFKCNSTQVKGSSRDNHIKITGCYKKEFPANVEDVRFLLETLMVMLQLMDFFLK